MNHDRTVEILRSLLRGCMYGGCMLGLPACFNLGGSDVFGLEARAHVERNDNTCSRSPGADAAGEVNLRDYLLRGSEHLHRALLEIALDSSLSGSSGESLALAEKCFSGARVLSPQSYEALLGSGITHLVRARVTGSHAHFLLADNSLKQAYLIRQGALEPLYYMAEIRFHNEDYKAAKVLLNVLEQNNVKLGPTYALRVAIALRENDDAQVDVYKQKAVQIGEPFASMAYLDALGLTGKDGE